MSVCIYVFAHSITHPLGNEVFSFSVFDILFIWLLRFDVAYLNICKFSYSCSHTLVRAMPTLPNAHILTYLHTYKGVFVVAVDFHFYLRCFHVSFANDLRALVAFFDASMCLGILVVRIRAWFDSYGDDLIWYYIFALKLRRMVRKYLH